MEQTDQKLAKELISELKTAAQKYYHSGTESPLSDEEFDLKREALETFKETLPELFEERTDGYLLLEGDPSLGTKPETENIIKHRFPMLSLGKAKKKEELEKFLTKLDANGAEGYVLQAKLDGFALSIVYENGKIKTIATRGDGIVGEDLTYLQNSQNLTIDGLPTELKNYDDLELRGEVFFTDEQFQKVDEYRYELTGTRFKKSRNAAVGLLKKAEKGLDYSVTMTFSTYAAISNGKWIDLSDLENESIETVNHLTKVRSEKTDGDTINLSPKTPKETLESVQKFGEIRPNLGIPTDGVVVKASNESKMREALADTSHHPSSQIAFKYPGESAITQVLEINNTVGKTGKVTPVAKIKTVVLDGSEVSNISLHNYNQVHKKDVRVGSMAQVTLANDVIPYLQKVIAVGDSPEITPPTHCPICQRTLVHHGDFTPAKVITCPNYDCASRHQFLLRTAVGKNYLDIDGLSSVLLDHLYETGRVLTIADLYTLTENEIKEMPLGVSAKGNPRKLGEKRAKNIIEHIEKSKTAPLYKLMSALGISTLGPAMAKSLIKTFGTFDEIRKAPQEEIEKIDDFGEIRAREVVEGLNRCSGLINTLIERGVQFDSQKSTDVDSDKTLEGISFAISGSVPEPFSNRTKWIDFIEENGGEFHSSPKENTTYMVAEENGTSSKVKKAKTLGIAFMSSEEFTQKYS